MSSLHGTSEDVASGLPGFEILRAITQGGMGRIYLARQHALNRLVCVKVMSIPEGEDADLCRSRFCREAELLASVSHPHILSIFDFGATPDLGLPFLVTEYIEGGDLRARMTSERAMPTQQARLILRQVGEALTHLHGKGILHRDLKPENILMPTESLVKVGDFGIAVMRDKAGLLTESLRGLGTLGYVSPEQQYGLKIDERTDVYSLAALAYELLTGRRPLGAFSPPSRANPGLSQTLDGVILRGLAEEPKNRYSSVREFMDAFEQALSKGSLRGLLSRPALVTAIMGLLVVAGMSTLTSLGWKRKPLSPRPVAAGSGPVKPAAALPVVLPAQAEPSLPAPKSPERSPDFNRLVELRAYGIWVASGRPTGKAGELVKEANWTEAERQIESEVKARAFEFWRQQGRPTGAAGAAVHEKNMRLAEAELLKETKDELDRHPLK
jgi:serine/threonine protein kinase